MPIIVSNGPQMPITLHHATQMPITRTLWNPNLYNSYVIYPSVPSTRTLRNPNAHYPLHTGTLITIILFVRPVIGSFSKPGASRLWLYPLDLFNITCPSTPRSCKWLFPSRFLPQTGIRFLFSVHATCPAHLIVRDLVTPTTFYEYCKYCKPLFVRFSPVFCYCQCLQYLSTQFSTDLALCSFLGTRDQVSNPY